MRIRNVFVILRIRTGYYVLCTICFVQLITLTFCTIWFYFVQFCITFAAMLYLSNSIIGGNTPKIDILSMCAANDTVLILLFAVHTLCLHFIVIASMKHVFLHSCIHRYHLLKLFSCKLCLGISFSHSLSRSLLNLQ